MTKVLRPKVDTINALTLWRHITAITFFRHKW